MQIRARASHDAQDDPVNTFLKVRPVTVDVSVFVSFKVSHKEDSGPADSYSALEHEGNWIWRH